MDEASLWLKADYFDRFRCKGGQCRASCCEGWEIAVSMKDYFRLISMDCDGELHHQLECAFRVPEEPSPEHFRMISPNWLGLCPLHDRDGLCMLHRGCGAQALPELCRVYPRSLKRMDGELRACCSASCEAVVELLLRDAPLRFAYGSLDGHAECEIDAADADLAMNRACMAALQDRRRPLAARVGWVCEQLSEAPFGADACAGEGLSALMAALTALRPNFHSLEVYGQPMFDRYDTPEEREDRYRQDVAAMESALPLWESWFENLLVNHVFYSGFPRVDDRLKAQDVCAGFCLLYGAMRALCAARWALKPDADNLTDGLSELFRMAEHSAFYYNARVLLDSPAALLAL